MLVFPCCKINLGLNIIGRRSDGYHDLETVFYPIPLHDNLEVSVMRNRTNNYWLHQSGIQVDGEAETNLVVRVYQLLREEFPHLPPIEIWLHKRIPSGAGLGGGSSDAAFMLKLLNEKFQLGLTNEDAEYHLSKLGADCPFFYEAKPAYATGIGNELSVIDFDLRGWHLVLVKPDIHISTKMAYSLVKPQPSQENLLLTLARPIETWKEHLKNDFEISVFQYFPQIAAIKQTLYDMGATYVSMSGSGSCLFALFKSHQPEAKEVFSDCFVYECKLERFI